MRLLDGSLQGAFVVTIVWAVCAACKSVPASIRTWLWWLACLKLVMALAAFPAVPIPVLPSTPHGAARTASARMVDTAAMALPVETIKRLPRAVLRLCDPGAQSMGWRSSALLLAMAGFALWWVAVLAVQAVALFATHRRLVALVNGIPGRRALSARDEVAGADARVAARSGRAAVARREVATGGGLLGFTRVASRRDESVQR